MNIVSRTLKVFAVTLSLSPLAGGVAAASTLNFGFSFQNIDSYGLSVGTVTGIVRGLDNNGTSAASSLEVLSFDGDRDGALGEYVVAGLNPKNSWIVVDGTITSANFTSLGYSRSEVNYHSLFIQTLEGGTPFASMSYGSAGPDFSNTPTFEPSNGFGHSQSRRYFLMAQNRTLSSMVCM